MKKLFSIVASILLTLTLWSQAPEKLSYQAVIRNNNNALVINSNIGMQISILQGSVDGSSVYTETQTPSTNANGLISIEIGDGNVLSGDFANINWANGPYFIKTETDLNGGANYTIIGTSQLLSVPYAFHAKTAETLTGTLNETDPVFSSWDKSTGITITENQIANLGNYIETEIDPTFTSWDKNYVSLTNRPSKISDFSLDATMQNITNLGNPVNPGDAVNKIYVDALLARVNALEETVLINTGFIDSRDRAHYNVVKINNKMWMAENLRFLPSVVGPATSSSTVPNYYVYGYNGTVVADAKANINYSTYGVLYNWPAAMNGASSSSSNPSGVQGVCPTGWHLPSDAEWTELTDLLGGSDVAGGKLKESGTAHWLSPNTGATNETGFTALPAGCRDGSNTFNATGEFGFWWSATQVNNDYVRMRFLGSISSTMYSDNNNPSTAYSVRCVKD